MLKESDNKLLGVINKYVKSGVFWIGTFLIVAGLGRYASQNITVSNSVDGRELPIYCVQTDEKKVALSFDAAWGNEDTYEILEILKNNDVRATFFMTGEWIDKYPEDVRRIYDAGHDLANHSDSHKYMTELSETKCRDEIQKAHEKVKNITGNDMNLFRPPYGDYDNDVVRCARELGYYTIQWDVDSLDWRDYGVEAIVNTVCEHENLGNGSIILCHNGAKYTAKALEKIIVNLKEQGYQIVAVSELIYKEDYHMDHEGRQVPN